MEFKDAKREHHSLLAAAEKRLLIRMAEGMPRRINSDHLTALGFAAMLAAGLTYLYARWNAYAMFAVIGWLAINWFGDSLDGTLARVRRQPRPRYGFYVDHVLDAFGTAALFVGLAGSGYMSWVVALGFLLGYFLLCIEIYLATYTLGEFHLSFGGVGPTELRLILAAGNVAAFFHPMVRVFGGDYKLFDVGGVGAAGGMVLVSMYAAAKHIRTLYFAEPLPRADTAGGGCATEPNERDRTQREALPDAGRARA